MKYRHAQKSSAKPAVVTTVCLLAAAGLAFAAYHYRSLWLPLLPAAGPVASSQAPVSSNPAQGGNKTPSSAGGETSSQPAETPAVTGLFADYSQQALETLEQMTLEEKIGQLFLARYPKSGVQEEIASLHPCGYVLFSRDFDGKSAEAVQQELKNNQQASKLPLIFAVDEEGGSVVRVSEYHALADHWFDSPQDLYAQGGLQAIVDDAAEKSQVLLNLGIQLNLAPVADVSTDAEDFIYDRTLGQDAQSTADYIALVVKKMNETGISGCLKHFPGYGNNVDTHNGIAVDKRPMEQFRSADFLPFSAGVQAGVPCILVSHNIVECMDSSAPASLSAEVHRVLREELGFTGVVMTDDLAMSAITDYTGGQQPAVTAFLAGNDLLLCSDFQEAYQALLAAAQSGEVRIEQVNQSVARILAWKYSKGLL